MKQHTSTHYATLLPRFDPTRNRWLCSDVIDSPGDFIFATETEANAFHASELRRLQDREAREARQAEEAKQEAKKRATYLASFKGFLPSDPMRAGRILQTLEKTHLYRGKVMNRKQTVELLVSEGRTLTEDGLAQGDVFAVIGKTERAYAAHLIALRDAGNT